MVNRLVIFSFFCLTIVGCKKEELIEENPFARVAGQYQWLYTERHTSYGNPFQGGDTHQYYVVSPQTISQTKSIIIQFDGTFQLYMGEDLAYENNEYDYTYFPESGSVSIDLYLGSPYFGYVDGYIQPWFFSGESGVVNRSSSFGTNASYSWFKEHWVRVK